MIILLHDDIPIHITMKQFELSLNRIIYSLHCYVHIKMKSLILLSVICLAAAHIKFGVDTGVGSFKVNEDVLGQGGKPAIDIHAGLGGGGSGHGSSGLKGSLGGDSSSHSSEHSSDHSSEHSSGHFSSHGSSDSSLDLHQEGQGGNRLPQQNGHEEHEWHESYGSGSNEHGNGRDGRDGNQQHDSSEWHQGSGEQSGHAGGLGGLGNLFGGAVSHIKGKFISCS